MTADIQSLDPSKKFDATNWDGMKDLTISEQNGTNLIFVFFLFGS